MGIGPAAYGLSGASAPRVPWTSELHPSRRNPRTLVRRVKQRLLNFTNRSRTPELCCYFKSRLAPVGRECPHQARSCQEVPDKGFEGAEPLRDFLA